MAVRTRARWQTLVESDFTLGIIRDTARTGIPRGGVYDAQNVLLHRPGVAFKRGGINHPVLPILNGDTIVAASQANFPMLGLQLITVSDTFMVTRVTDSSRFEYGFLTGFTDIIDPPTLYVGGLTNVLVFCDSTGTKIPWFYNGGDGPQEFKGGNIDAAGDYTLSISGTPTGGSFKLAVNFVSEGLSYITAAIAFNASGASVESALEAAAPETFAATGGPLPGTPVVVTVPAGWSINYLTPAQSGVALTGGTDPSGAISAVDGTAVNVPTAIHSTSHLQRLILANSSVNPNRIWFGPILDPVASGWDTASSWIDMDQAVTGIASLSGQLIVFAEDSMWRIVGDTPPPDSNMDRQRMGQVGCTDARSIVTYQGQCIFANPRSVYVTTGIAPVSLMTDRIESYWQSLFSGYDPATWTISAGMFAGQFLFVTILDDAKALVQTFVCDLRRRGWTTHTRPLANMYAASEGTAEILYAASADSEFLEEVSSFFTPDTGNDEDAQAGPFGWLLETRPVGYTPGLKAWGDAHLSFDLADSGETPTLAVSVAAGAEAPSFSAVPESPLAASDGFARQRLTVSDDTETVSFRFEQALPSAKAEVYAVETDVRPYWGDAELE